MMSDGESNTRICQACGKDCAGQPRIKDKKGRYLHKACFEKARAKAKQKAAALETAATENILGLGDDGGGLGAGVFDEIQTSAPVDAMSCPDCGSAIPSAAILCTACGHNFQSSQSGRKIKIAKDKSESPAENSLWIGLGVFGVLLGLGIGARMRSDLYLPLELAGMLIAIPLWFWVLIEAFKQGFGRGLASLIIPFYMLYWLNSYCDKPMVKAVGTAAYAAPVILRVLSLSGILPSPSFGLPE